MIQRRKIMKIMIVYYSAYGASTIAGTGNTRWLSENELAGARFQGRHVAVIAGRLFR
jgi:NAD(P)H dehydrogenase (quinone)